MARSIGTTRTHATAGDGQVSTITTVARVAQGRFGSSAWPSSTACATSTTRRPVVREWSRSSSNACRSSTPWRSIRIPFARSITRAALERALELVDLLVQALRLAVAAQRDLDRPLHRLGVHRLDAGGDAALGGAREEVDVGVRQLGDHGPRGVLDRLADQRQRVLVVLVDTTIARSRVLRGDQLDRLADRDGVRRHLVAELGQHAARSSRSADASSSATRTRRLVSLSVASRRGCHRRTLRTRLIRLRPSDPPQHSAPRTPALQASTNGEGVEHRDRSSAGQRAATAQHIRVPATTADARAREDRRLLERYHREGDPAAREALVQRFLPLARQLARRYQRGGEPLDDLIQVASLGLLKAIDRFDPARETAFSSFAVPTILGELKRHFRDKGWSVRVPRDLQELAVKVEPVAEELARELGRAPTPAEIAERIGATLEQVLEAREAAGAYRAVSLDRPRDGRGRGGRRPRGRRSASRTPASASAEDAATVERLMRVLTEREREVLRLRFAEDLTQSEIGERVGVSQMHVSRLIRQSVARLREAADERGDAQSCRYAPAPWSTGTCARSTSSRTIRRSCTRPRRGAVDR